MNKKSRIKNKDAFIFFGLMAAVIFFPFVLKRFFPNIYAFFPYLANSRDWLGIIADGVQALGFITLIYFFFDLSRKNRAMQISRTPNLIMKLAFVDVWPKAEASTLCEKNKSAILQKSFALPAKYTMQTNDYLKLWELMGPSKRINYYLRIELNNNQGRANKLRLFIQLDYQESQEEVQKLTQNLWCPLDGLTIESNETKFLFLRCGRLKNRDFKFVSGRIVDYVCENMDGEMFIGSENNFKPVEITAFRFE